MTISEINTSSLGAVGGSQGSNQSELQEAAQEFEAVFLAQALQGLTSGLDQGGLLGDSGNSADSVSGMYQDEIAKLISRSGGIGIADSVMQEMLKSQEVA